MMLRHTLTLRSFDYVQDRTLRALNAYAFGPSILRLRSGLVAQDFYIILFQQLSYFGYTAHG
jgi:hypothetical protein